MTQDRKGPARDDDNLDVGSFGLGLADLGDLDGDPSEMFGGSGARQASAPKDRPSSPARSHQPEPDDLPAFGDPSFGDHGFGGPGDFDDAPPASSAPAARNVPDPGDWSSLAGLGGGSASRAPVSGGHDDAGDPDAEFAEAQFGGARSVASLGRIPDDPDPKGRYRQDEPVLDDVVSDFAGGDDDYAEPPKPSLYRADPTDEEDVDEGDRSLSLSDDDEGDDDRENEDEDEDEAAGPSIVERLKRFAIPVAAAAAIGGGAFVGWPHLAPLIGMGGEEYPAQAAAPVVPKQPQQAAAIPAFPPSAQPPQRPALPGGSSLLPAAPGQQAVAVQPGLPGQQQALPGSGVPPRQIGFPPQPQQAAYGQLPQSAPPTGMQLPVAPPQGTGIQQVALPDRLPAEPQPVVQAPPASPPNVLAGGFNARTAPAGDVEARLASIASDLSTIRIRQEDAARAAQSDRDDFGRRLGALEKRVGEGGKVMTPKPVAEEVKPRKTERAERVERAERPARSARRAAYQQEASASDDGVPPLKPKVVQGFSLKGVSRNVATVEGRSGVVEVGVGQTIPGVGEVKAIRRYGGDWVVVVGKGVIVQQ